MSTPDRRGPSSSRTAIEQQRQSLAEERREFEALRARLGRQAEKLDVRGDPTSTQRDRFELLVEVERQARLVAEQRRALDALRSYSDRQDARLAEALGILALVRTSRMYRVMRLLGRWGWLERRIRRALR